MSIWTTPERDALRKTVRAFAIVSSAGKGSTTGVLLAIHNLASGSTYPAGTVIRVPVLLTLSNPV